MIRFDVLTLFPEMFGGPFGESILKRAVQANRISLNVYDIRDYTQDRHHTADDYPFGGGAGLVLKAEPIFAAIQAIRSTSEPGGDVAVILLAAQGRQFTQGIAEEIAKRSHVVLICGHYEGIDDRVRQTLATDEISIGDYILTGGELAAMVVVDATARLIPGVLGDADSLTEESLTSGVLEYPQFTRPASFDHLDVPPVLLSGDHAAIKRWRREQALTRTYLRRPDLLRRAPLDRSDGEILESLVPSRADRRNGH